MRQSFAKETFSYDEYLKIYNIQYWKPDVRERKKTGVHGTLQMILLAWKFNSKQLLSKTLNSRMNIIETRAFLKTENLQVELNSGFLKWCVFQKEKLMITFSANTWIDGNVWIFFKTDILKHVDKIVS